MRKYNTSNKMFMNLAQLVPGVPTILRKLRFMAFTINVFSNYFKFTLKYDKR